MLFEEVIKLRLVDKISIPLIQGCITGIRGLGKLAQSVVTVEGKEQCIDVSVTE